MLIERNQIGKREMLADLIARVDAKSTPVQSLIPKGESLTNMLFEWQMDNFEEPDDVAVEDGVDVDTFDNASPDRALAQMYAMKVRDSAMVSDLAENVSDVAGLSKGEMAESIMKKLKKIARAIEANICGDQECAAGSAGVPYRGRGLGKWIQSTAQGTLAVNANYRTPSASINSTTVASLTEANVNDVIESIYLQTGQTNTFNLVCGSTLRRQFSTFTRTVGSEGSTRTPSQYAIQTYNKEFKGTAGFVVNTFDGDFGTLNVIPTLWNAHKDAAYGGDGSTVATGKCRGYVLDNSLLSMHYKRLPRVKELEDRGGGPRFLVDAVFGWKVKNPLGLGKFSATS